MSPLASKTLSLVNGEKKRAQSALPAFLNEIRQERPLAQLQKADIHSTSLIGSG